MAKIEIEVPDDQIVDGKFGGKWGSVADIINSANSAQAKISEQGREIAALKGQVAPPRIGAPIEALPPDPSRKQAAAGAILQQALMKLQNGDPGAEAELVALGMEPDFIEFASETMMDGTKKALDTVYEAAGGTFDHYKELIEWAGSSESVSPPERRAIMRTIKSGNISATINQVNSLRQRYKETEGHEARDAIVAVPGGAGRKVQGYASVGDMKKAYMDPRYQTDTAYTNEVLTRSGLTNLGQNAQLGDSQGGPG